MFILIVHALLFIGGKAKGEVTYSLIFRRPRVNKWVVIVTFEEGQGLRDGFLLLQSWLVITFLWQVRE